MGQHEHDNPHDHDNYNHNKIVRERSRQVMRKMWRVEQNTTSSEYSITRGVGNSRGQRKTRVVSPVTGQGGCPGREPDCLNRVGVSSRMYNDLNSLGDGAKEGRGRKDRHAGTGEGISTYIHVANSHTDRAEVRG